MVGAGGQLLERSIVDRMVGAPERLVFEAAPILAPPLMQDVAARAPKVIEGQPFDTSAVLILSAVETARFKNLHAAAARELAPVAQAVRKAFIARQVARLMERNGCTTAVARRTVERLCDGILLPDVELPFDLPDLAGKTVADVLADPERFEGATLSDPLEGPAYGICKAKVMRRTDGSPWIHSYAHGRTAYQLRHDAAAIEQAMNVAPAQAADTLVSLAPMADIGPDEDQALRDLACRLAGVKARPLALRLKISRQKHEQQRHQAEREANIDRLLDKRVRLCPPDPSHERLPILTAIDEVLVSDSTDEPPTRDVEGRPTEARSRQPIQLHDMIDNEIGIETEPSKPVPLPPPAMLLLTPHDDYSMAHLIEQHINLTVS